MHLAGVACLCVVLHHNLLVRATVTMACLLPARQSLCRPQQLMCCRCLADLLLGQKPMFDIAPLSAQREAVQPINVQHAQSDRVSVSVS